MTDAACSCVVLLGAATYPQYPALDNTVIAASAKAYSKYFADTPALNVSPKHLLDLFDSPANATDQMLLVRRHLRQFESDVADARKNVFLIYVGHGLVSDGPFSLAINSTDETAQTESSLNMPALAKQLKQLAAWSRRFIILDCCYAGESLRDFLSVEAMTQEAKMAFESYEVKYESNDPKRGTTVLCASDRYTRARASQDRPRTLFTGALMEVLEQGSSHAPPMMTFNNVLDLVRGKLGAPGLPQPVLVSPDQTEGDLAHSLRLFPNPLGQDVSEIKAAEPPIQTPNPSETVALKSKRTAELPLQTPNPSETEAPEFARTAEPLIQTPNPLETEEQESKGTTEATIQTPNLPETGAPESRRPAEPPHRIAPLTIQLVWLSVLDVVREQKDVWATVAGFVTLVAIVGFFVNDSTKQQAYEHAVERRPDATASGDQATASLASSPSPGVASTEADGSEASSAPSMTPTASISVPSNSAHKPRKHPASKARPGAASGVQDQASDSPTAESTVSPEAMARYNEIIRNHSYMDDITTRALNDFRATESASTRSSN